MDDPENLARAVAGGDRRSLARAITLVESTRADHRAAAIRLLDALPRAEALRIGLSATARVDISRQDGAVLGAPMPRQPVYATAALGQPLAQASAAAAAIVQANLAR